ncbi:cyclic GMP-AMP synthase-like receptor [Plodia interpunctella]|uniref:cyclic GMP-AMP synthase-like receptor n=1 Tax=Plodia interpunctella TaxID=58824 RepID=UPI0023681E0D|nr:cyclic GMP-AMP synthase-like receptor [Plodia interpunctella]
MNKKKNVLNLYLEKIFENNIALKDNDIKLSQEVFKSVFDQVKQRMEKKCNYFAKYSSQVMFAGSVYDGIKVSKLDEFDMDIVIRLPISYDHGENGIILENEDPGFVKMKITNPFDNLVRQPDWENCHKVTHDWRDDEKYFLQNKFRHWIQGIVSKALYDMENKVCVNGVSYVLKYTQSGPAYTLKIRAEEAKDPFTLDVDLVPVIRFRHPRWPKGYREPLNCEIKDWLLVPKPNKAVKEASLQNRCWRLSFQEFEKDMMKGCQNLKKTIRLVKKLRDVLRMKYIASYYIKTLFLWKISETSKKYWETTLSVLFQTMVEILRDAIQQKTIQYFWNKDHNLIKELKDSLRDEYVSKLNQVLTGIENNDVDKVLPGLLTTEELVQFKKYDFYQKHNAATPANRSVKPAPVDRELIETLIKKMDDLSTKVNYIGDEISKLKVGNELKEEFLCLVGDLDEISDEVEDLGFDTYNPKRIKKMDGSKASPKGN